MDIKKAMIIKRAWTNTITATNDPLAPIKLEEAYSTVYNVAMMLSVLANEDEVNHHQTRLLQDFSDEELEQLGGTPAFIIAIASILTESLLEYGKEVNK